MSERVQEGYCVRVTYKPSAPDDPIPWLATIYQMVPVESFWRGTELEAVAVMEEWIDGNDPDGRTICPIEP